MILYYNSIKFDCLVTKLFVKLLNISLESLIILIPKIFAVLITTTFFIFKYFFFNKIFSAAKCALV